MTITTLPALSRSSPTFKTEVDTFFGSQLPTFSTELNTEIDRINQIGFGSYSATSTTSLIVGTGTKSLTVQTGKGFAVGQAIIIAQTSNAANYMAGQVTSYNSSTGALVVNATIAAGTGTITGWTISVTAINAPTGTIGTVYTGRDMPTDGTWLEINGSVYLQSSYASLYAKLGLLANQPQSALGWVNNAGITSRQSAVVWTGSEFVTCPSNGMGIVGYRLGATGTGNTATGTIGPQVQTIASNGLTSGNLTVALASSGTYVSSDGGATWGSGGSVTSGNYQVCIYANSQFVAVGNSVIATSPTGGTWTNRSFTGNLSAITYAGSNIWIAGFYGSGNITRSTDNAVTWPGTTVATGLSAITDLVEFNGLIVAVGRIGTTTGAIAVSKDAGLSFQIVNSGFASSILNAATGGGVVMAIGSGFATYSVNGYNWTTSTSVGANIAGSSNNALAYGNGRFVAVNDAATNGAQYLENPVLSYNTSTQFTVGVPMNTSYKQWVKAA